MSALWHTCSGDTKGRCEREHSDLITPFFPFRPRCVHIALHFRVVGSATDLRAQLRDKVVQLKDLSALLSDLSFEIILG
jgi:hypothetical protein